MQALARFTLLTARSGLAEMKTKNIATIKALIEVLLFLHFLSISIVNVRWRWNVEITSTAHGLKCYDVLVSWSWHNSSARASKVPLWRRPARSR